MRFINKLYYHTWNIGFVESNAKDIVLSGPNKVQVHWIKHKYKDRFFADPFILSANDKEIKVLVEDFPYYDKKGMISLLTVDRVTYELIDKKIVLNKPYHMSYPFILRKDNGEVWVAPEASQSGQLFYYNINRETGHLENQRVLLQEPLLDSTIVEYNDKWWLFCTKRGEASNKDLFIYYSDQPEGPWAPHKMNPVICDMAMARPAGYFVKFGDVIYRVSQKCDKCYGEAVNVSRVLKLTETEFEEEFVKELHAQNDEYSHCFHTLNGLGNLTVVDGVKKQFAPLRRIIYEIRNIFKI